LFTKTHAIEKVFDEYSSKIDKIINSLRKHEDFSLSFVKIKDNFASKTNDFYREDRKLRIAVIGQVKAGKSTFLNTMLFDGQDVLPRAATPKTANLSVIKYGDTNFLEIDFYSKSEWDELVKLARSAAEIETDEIKVAKEILGMVQKHGISVEEYLGKNDYRIEFTSYDELLGRLNDFAGADGKITPLVKSLQMTINNEKIKNIEIVDTPGMNDPIVSRTDKTRQFIEYCDVVFFLSRCPKFLDKTDMELLTRQLPQKGVGKIYLIGSQYDSSINDSIWEKGSYQKADADNKKRLMERANIEFGKLLEKMKERNVKDSILEVISSCKKPILISCMAHNMAKKERVYYNKEEMVVFEGISEYEKKFNNEMLHTLGNFGTVNSVFSEIVENKDKTLEAKAVHFIPASVAEVNGELDALKSKIEKRITLLSANDIAKLKESKKHTLSLKHKVKADIENVFGGVIVNLEKIRTELFGEIRKAMKTYSRITERTGSEERTGYYEVSASRWWNPFSWGSTKLEAYTYTATYTYLDLSDAIENIRNYANDASTSIEEKLNESLNLSKTKRELLTVVVQNFDTTDDDFDPAYFRLLVEKTLNSVEIPVIKIDIKNEIKNLTSSFSGEIRDGSEKSSLQLAMNDALQCIFEFIEGNLVKEFVKIKSSIQNLKDSLADQLLKDITDELDNIEQLFKNREKELKNNEELLKVIIECKKLVA